MNIEPTTNEEWTIHALNIHGTFFERRCQQVIAQAKGWRIQSTNYPVEFPATGHGKASNLDIWAEGHIAQHALQLLVECKKNNPEFVDWIFFPTSPHRPIKTTVRVLESRFVPPTSPLDPYHYDAFPLLRELLTDLVIADEARETREDYQSRNRNDRQLTKTSNTAITDAATQIALATQAILYQEEQTLKKYFQRSPVNQPIRPPPVFLPVIVTTANLFTCDFQDVDVDLNTGEIAFENVVLQSHPCLLYGYPVPHALQRDPEEMGTQYSRENLEEQARMSIIVVQSAFFPTLLARLSSFTVREDGVMSFSLKSGEATETM